MLVSRPVIAFALLRQCSELMETDLLGGVAVLVRPVVTDLVDQLFDSRLLSERLGQAYGVSIPPAALDGMLHRLAAANILRIEQFPSGITKALYNQAVTMEPLGLETEADFQDILDGFLKHAHDRLEAVEKSFSDDELLSGFLRHLATLDFSAAKLKPQIDPDGKKILGPSTRAQLELSDELADRAALDSLVASFIASLKEHRPDQFGLLTKVSDGALAAELVFDLQAPSAVSKLNKTIVVVDTPLILSYLDLSSSQDFRDVRQFFDLIRDAGATIAAFQHSIEETEGVLKAIQNARGVGEAYGPSVYRLSNSTFRAYFESMIGTVRRRWTGEHGFQMLPQAAEHSYKHFTELDEENLVSSIQLSAYDRVQTRERDAKSVAEIMRRLAGARIPANSIESCDYVFVTSNATLQRRVATFLEKNQFVLPTELNPIVTSRYFSGLCWLICGGKSEDSPTMAKLLANCAAALRLRPEIADRTKRFLAAIDPEKARHFEVLMTNERASQYMAEATLGDISVVTANNAEEIFEEVQRRAAEKVAIEKDQEYQRIVDSLKNDLLRTETDAGEIESLLVQTKHEADQSKKEIEALTKRADILQVDHESGVAKLDEQSEKIENLSALVERSAAVASDAKNQLSQHWGQARQRAEGYAKSRTEWLRWAGVILMVSLVVSSTYVDKFVSPSLDESYRQLINYGLIFIQVVLALSGFSLISERVSRRPLEMLRKFLYSKRLRDLGIPDHEE